MGKSICVYCSSSSAVPEVYVEAARELGGLIGRRGHSLVYGGGGVGLMGILAESARAAGALVTGVLPEAFVGKGISSRHVDRLVITRDLRERKAAMERQSDGFIALPGGFGTLEELLEILTLRQLGFHEKPVALVDTEGFYAPLLGQLERIYELRFAKPDYRLLYRVARAPAEAVQYVESYAPVQLPAKWMQA